MERSLGYTAPRCRPDITKASLKGMISLKSASLLIKLFANARGSAPTLGSVVLASVLLSLMERIFKAGSRQHGIRLPTLVISFDVWSRNRLVGDCWPTPNVVNILIVTYCSLTTCISCCRYEQLYLYLSALVNVWHVIWNRFKGKWQLLRWNGSN